MLLELAVEDSLDMECSEYSEDDLTRDLRDRSRLSPEIKEALVTSRRGESDGLDKGGSHSPYGRIS